MTTVPEPRDPAPVVDAATVPADMESWGFFCCCSGCVDLYGGPLDG